MPTAFIVTSLADSGPNTLRQAIVDSNANPGSNAISFQIVGAGVQTIDLLSTLTITSPVVIDGTTQPGYAGSPLIALDGTNETASGGGLVITAGNTTVKGLSINGFTGLGIELQVNGGDVISNNVIGTVSPDTAVSLNTDGGILINNVANNTISTNVISGNQSTGVIIQGVGAVNNLVQGNLIGTDRTGTLAAPNGDDGVDILQGASNNTVGGLDSTSENLISGNFLGGVTIGGAGTSGNLIQHNIIGTDTSGSVAIRNTFGIYIFDGANGNTVSGNLISGNAGDGVEISDVGTSGNVVIGNLIGTDITGATVIGNGIDGVVVFLGATRNTIGGTALGAGNTIAGNASDGLVLENAGTSHNLVQGNFIGTNKAGDSGLGNGLRGVDVFDGASNNTIGGGAPGAGNTLSGNGDAGVDFQDGASGNIAQNNFIGTDLTGKRAIQNQTGVVIEHGGSGNTIIGNVISANQADGVAIRDSQSTNNIIVSNRIGVPALPSSPDDVFLGNGEYGIFIVRGASNNTVGGATNGSGNLIAQNTGGGIEIDGSGTSGNVVLGNTIGDGSGRESYGVGIGDGAADNTIGGVTGGNTITGHAGGGVFIFGSTGTRLINNTITAPAGAQSVYPNISVRTASHTIITGNRVSGAATDGIYLFDSPSNLITGNTIISNGRAGIYVDGQSAGNMIGGNLGTAASNVLEGNRAAGVVLTGDGVVRTLVQGNYIGIDPVFYANHPNGPKNTGNGGDGIILGGHNNTVGGPPAAANVISENKGAGVSVVGQNTGLAILSNLIFGNQSGIGIFRPTPSAVLPPTMSLALTTSGGADVRGVVQSVAGLMGSYIVQFFAIDPTSGFQTLAGQQSVMVGANGSTPFHATLAQLKPGQTLIATVTDPKNSTSVFSASQPIQAGVADLAVTVVSSANSITIGQPITFTVTITNQGPTLATGVTFVDVILAGAALGPVTVATPTGPGTFSFAAGQVVSTIGDLAASVTATVTITVLPPATGAAQNNASATSAEQDPNPANNSTVSTASVLPLPVTATSFRVVNQVVKRRKQAVIDVDFSGALDMTTASQKAFYSLWTAGRDKKFGTKDDVAVVIATIQVAPSQATVIITPKSALPRNKTLQVRVNALGVHDSSGRPLIGGDASGRVIGTLSSNVSKAQVKAAKVGPR
jgi:uncharacterized repeat protein (TIGR01451 family)